MLLVLLFLTFLHACGAGYSVEDCPKTPFALKSWENDQELLETHKTNLLTILRNHNYQSMQYEALSTFVGKISDNIEDLLEKHYHVPSTQIIGYQRHVLRYKKWVRGDLEILFFYFYELNETQSLLSLNKEREPLYKIKIRYAYENAYRNVLSALEDFCANSEVFEGSRVSALQKDLDEIRAILLDEEKESLARQQRDF
ncbi:MAG: hypothetical protein OXC30_00655 [Alphaproteobacteria bacterium]|nr:hypothetical protein [Alphaproteobacteria bacterium]